MSSCNLILVLYSKEKYNIDWDVEAQGKRASRERKLPKSLYLFVYDVSADERGGRQGDGFVSLVTEQCDSESSLLCVYDNSLTISTLAHVPLQPLKYGEH